VAVPAQALVACWHAHSILSSAYICMLHQRSTLQTHDASVRRAKTRSRTPHVDARSSPRLVGTKPALRVSRVSQALLSPPPGHVACRTSERAGKRTTTQAHAARACRPAAVEEAMRTLSTAWCVVRTAPAQSACSSRARARYSDLKRTGPSERNGANSAASMPTSPLGDRRNLRGRGGKNASRAEQCR